MHPGTQLGPMRYIGRPGYARQWPAMCRSCRRELQEPMMSKSNTDQFLDNNQRYARGEAVHAPA